MSETPPPRKSVDVWICLDDTESFVAGDIRRGKLPPELTGWARCDGAQLTRSKFPRLFEEIGTRFGTRSLVASIVDGRRDFGIEDDGATFLLPDLRSGPWPGDPLPPLEEV